MTENEVLQTCASCVGTALLSVGFGFAVGTLFGVIFALTGKAVHAVKQIMHDNPEKQTS